MCREQDGPDAQLAPWRPKLIDAKPSNNSELEQSIASESEDLNKVPHQQNKAK